MGSFPAFLLGFYWLLRDAFLPDSIEFLLRGTSLLDGRVKYHAGDIGRIHLSLSLSLSSPVGLEFCRFCLSPINRLLFSVFNDVDFHGGSLGFIGFCFTAFPQCSSADLIELLRPGTRLLEGQVKYHATKDGVLPRCDYLADSSPRRAEVFPLTLDSLTWNNKTTHRGLSDRLGLPPESLRHSPLKCVPPLPMRTQQLGSTVFISIGFLPKFGSRGSPKMNAIVPRLQYFHSFSLFPNCPSKNICSPSFVIQSKYSRKKICFLNSVSIKISPVAGITREHGLP